MASTPGGSGGGGGGGLKAILENRKLRVKGPLAENMMFLKAAKVTEGLSTLFEMQVDFLSPKYDLKLDDLVGKPITVRVQMGEDNASGAGGTGRGTGETTGEWREFMGTSVEAQYIGYQEGYGFYSLKVRPWFWFLTRTWGIRIFQKLDAIKIIKKIFGEKGFSDYEFKTSRTPVEREYCVQYNETDFDFISRLMEEEGIYYYSTVKGGKDFLILTDHAGGHEPIKGNPTVQFHLRETGGMRRKDDHVFDFRSGETQRTGKVSINDYNFEMPTADRKTAKAIPKGSHSHKSYERYKYPGRYRELNLGEHYVRVKAEADAWPYQQHDVIGNVREMATGSTFTLANMRRSTENMEYLVTSAVHWMQTENAQDESQQMKDIPGSIKFEEENKDAHRVNFKIIPKATPFRAPLTTKWPEIPGILIAKVTGPKGEEIYTDKYGRIKVQFPWDRDGKNDENTTCWIRVVTPWSGVNWGMVHVPRIGQEVMIQFEDGDIDRPICTGMVYNADTMPPYTLPDNKTQMGIKTRSSKGGKEENYNELVFEDLKGKEFVRMHSEKDYFLTVENDATVSIGQTKKDPGSLKTDIHKDRTETIHTGDLTLTVKSGNEKRDIKTDRSEKIGQHASQEVGGNKKMTVKGNFEGSTSGNSTSKVNGNSEETVTGSFTSKVTGPIKIESTAMIELVCGGSKITINPGMVEIKSAMIVSDASGMAMHKSGGIMIIQGSLVMVN